ncbi:hypothetical protein B0H19DRAFT_99469 [Mycena capillaripes]|nr:hypothetical protein B0H19DRAFT_99469 [Mycena capillaripes]
MFSKTLLAEATVNAQVLHTFCETTPSMNAYQALVASAVDLCRAATPDSRKKASSLAAHTVKRTARVIESGIASGASVSSSLAHGQNLDKFKSTPDNIHKHIESIPEQGLKPQKFRLSTVKFSLESARLKKELDRVYALINTPRKSAARNPCVVEIATIGTRAAGVLCDIPGLNLLRPVVGMVGLICETAKVSNSIQDLIVSQDPDTVNRL